MKYISIILFTLFFITGCTNNLNSQLQKDTSKKEEIKTEETKVDTNIELPKKFLIYFQIDSVNIQEQSNDVLVDAVLTAKKTNYSSIEIVGHSDKSGNRAYNEKLSLSRAESIAGYLVVNGINKYKMKVYSLGESQPLVDTEDGEVNDLNRRVEIILN